MDDSDIVDFTNEISELKLPDFLHNIDTLIDTQMFRTDSVITMNTLHADQKAKDSQSKLNKLDKDILQKTEELNLVSQKSQALKLELESLKEKYDFIKSKESREMKEVLELETLCKNRATFKLHPVDRERFQNLRLRLGACKKLTRIKWYYGESSDTKLKGLVCNPHTSYIKKFAIDLHKTQKTEVSKQLWNMIYFGAIERKQISSENNKNLANEVV